jgi:hypothetical protein
VDLLFAAFVAEGVFRSGALSNGQRAEGARKKVTRCWNRPSTSPAAQWLPPDATILEYTQGRKCDVFLFGLFRILVIIG